MSQAFLSRVPRIGLAVLGAVVLLGLSGSGSRTSASDRGWPTEVAAVYKIAFNGFDIGRFTFTSHTGSGNYRDPIIFNVGGNTPNNTRTQQLP